MRAAAMLDCLVRLIRDEDGQDILEYALLCAFIAFAGMAAFAAMSATIGTAYQGWDSNINNDPLWRSCEPGMCS
jgi:Flp pilus assembly pilin Flp